MPTELQWTSDLGRNVILRPETSDRQVWADTFTGRYHLPPEKIRPKTVLDLGANIGLTAAHYATMWPEAQIVAVEMDEECAEIARQNTEAQGVVVRQHAVSDIAGWGSYDRSRLAEAYSFVPSQLVHEGRRVMAHTLQQTILRAFGTEGVDFVKMDVEGAEWGILAEPEWAPLVTYLLIELHPIGDMPNDSDVLVQNALQALTFVCGFNARPHTAHPRAVWAWR